MSDLSSWEICAERTTLPPHLPIANHEESLLKALRETPVLIIAGETGSGKTTQVPKLCIKAGHGKKGKILMTQPRRLAATRTAMRIAEEMELNLGEQIGYRIRFQHQTKKDTLLEVVTDGIPLSGNLKRSPFKNYETVIVDEVHERSINIDLLLGLLNLERKKRPDLKIILMSATLDIERLSAFFPEAKVFTVEGRTHPVTIEYAETNSDATLPEKVTQQVLQEIRANTKGNILCFLPTERDIKESEQKLLPQIPASTECLPLYSRLSQKDQDKVFKSSQARQKIILSTNIAETSLTLPNIRTVIDTGFVRLLRYHSGRGIPLLEVENISQASANQRSGRAGRTAAGTCVRLYSQDIFQTMEEHTVPEIKRQDLAQVILKLIALGLKEPQEFPFVEKPQPRAFKKGIDQLSFLQAIRSTSQGWEITPLGREMVKLPLSPRLAHLMTQAKREHMACPLSVVSAFLSLQDPRITPADKLPQSRASHLKWQVKNSDHMGMIKLFQAYQTHKKEQSGRQLRKWCVDNYLDWRRMREWDQLSHELCELVKGQWENTLNNLNEVRFHQLILGSHLDCLLEKDIPTQKQKPTYKSIGRREIVPHPSSTLSGEIQDWAVCSGFLSTSRVFALHLCKIEPKWVLHQAQGLIKVTRGDPHFDPKSQKVVSEEKHLFKEHLIHVQKLKDHQPFDPYESTDVFIRQGLLERQCTAPSLSDFINLLETLNAYNAAERSREIYTHPERLVDAWKLKWQQPCSRLSDFKKLTAEQQCLELEDVLDQGELITCIEDFPLSFNIEGKDYPIYYTYKINDPLDGAHLHVDLESLTYLEQKDLETLVPRYFLERLHQAYQCLPNAFRKEFSEDKFKTSLLERWDLSPELTFLHILELWLEQHTVREKAVKKTLQDFTARELPHLIPKIGLVNKKKDLIDTIQDISIYRSKSESSLLNRLAQKNKRKLEILLPSMEDDFIPERCQQILFHLKEWPDEGKVLAKTPKKVVYAWPALILKQEQWKIIAHPNKERAREITLNHLGLCLGPMSTTEVSFEAHDLDQLRDLKQSLNDSIQILKDLSRLSLWQKVREQDLESFETLSQRLIQLETKKWLKLSKRWLKWMIKCTHLFQNSIDLKFRSPQPYDLIKMIDRLTHYGKPNLENLLSKNLPQIEEEMKEATMLLNWFLDKSIPYDKASITWNKLNKGFLKIQKHELYSKLYPAEGTWTESHFNQDITTLHPNDLNEPAEQLKTKLNEITQLETILNEHQSWLKNIQQELKQPNNQKLHKKLQKHLDIIEANFLDHDQQWDQPHDFCESIEQFKKSWEKLKQHKVDLLDHQVDVDHSKFKNALINSWKPSK